AQWWARAPVAAAGDVDVLLLPQFAPCSLSGTIDPRSAPVLAPFGDRRLMIVGSAGGASTPKTFVAPLDTGAISSLPVGLQTSRAGPSATAFGDGLLVAGGTIPDTSTVLADAVVYDSAKGDFDQANPIKLDQPRTSHGAVALLTGETLLVGGAGE